MEDTSSNFIAVSGGLLSLQFIKRLRQENSREKWAQPETFSMPGESPLTPSELDRKITDAWKRLLDRWLTVGTSIEKYDVATARKKWIIPVLETLDYNPHYLKKDIGVSVKKGEKIHLSHRGGDWDHAPVIHTVAPSQNLDEKATDGRGVKSPHDSLQILLNESKEDQWGIVTNGLELRLLRDYYHTYTKGYVGFNLNEIFEGKAFSDFLAMYRLTHPSRFIPDEDGMSPLEHFYEISFAAGEKIGDELRENVKKAIQVLGNGFLTRELIQKMIKDPEECKEYYREILHVIYRIMFLMFAEQRGMLPARNSLYSEAYSITSLREKASRILRRDKHKDIWKGLLVTFKIIRNGVEDAQSKLTTFGYNGSLFDETGIQRLESLDCENEAVLKAIRYLTYFEGEGFQQRISYVDLGVEEIGSIYESLLDYMPRVLPEDIAIDGELHPANTFFLDPRGAARKSTGSYYTHPGLIHELIQSALKPVLEDRLEGKKSVMDMERALLSIRICDPACGSGAFLIAATNFLGKELARIRTDTEYPPDKEERKARRDVLQHCIYGVDLNPMAIELAKVSLWINACVKDMPLNFLDHHIKWGNSLIGTTPELLRKGIPDDAFVPVTGDNGEHAKRIVEVNKRQRGDRTLEERVRIEKERRKYEIEYGKLNDFEERKPEDVESKKKKYDSIKHSPELLRRKMIADTWTAAFFWPLNSENPRPPTEGILRAMNQDEENQVVDERILEMIKELESNNEFFHWYLEFPDIFSGVNPGFDCILGNPPWDKLKIMEREWFSGRDDEIANCGNKQKRTRLISLLGERNPELYRRFMNTQRKSELQTKFVSRSGRFPLSAKGDINTYPLFTELSGMLLVNEVGRIGLVVKTAISTDYYTKNLFSHFIETDRLVSLYDFINSKRIFPAVAPPERFCLLTLTGITRPSEKFEFSFHNTDLEMVRKKSRHYSLSREEIKLINPNTGNCPVLKLQKDKDIVLEIYRKFPILMREKEENTWGVTYSTLFHMSNDSGLFIENTKEDLESKGYIQKKNGLFVKGGDVYLPVYEAKNINLYDHRFGTFKGIPRRNRFRRRAQPHSPTIEQKQDVEYEIEVRYWMSKNDFEAQHGLDWDKDWIFAFRNVTRPNTDTRSTMGTIAPLHPFGNSAPILTFQGLNPIHRGILFASVFLSFTFDYVLHQKMGGTNLNLFILEQLPMPTPEQIYPWEIHYEEKSERLDTFLIERATKLIVTSDSLKCVLDELGIESGPFIWDEEERRQLMWEIDAAVAHLYGLARETYAYIFDEFRIQKDKDINAFGTFITKEKCLELFDRMSLEVRK